MGRAADVCCRSVESGWLCSHAGLWYSGVERILICRLEVWNQFMKKLLFFVAVLLGVGLLAACMDVGYYVQSIRGHLDVMGQTRPIEALVNDPQTSRADREKFVKVLEIRDFAVSELGLPDNGSYRHYADIGRPYVVWNVVAAPKYSLQPKQWCFPVAGCVSYRGYFDQAAADALGDQLQAEGFDVNVYGVPAYSTLQWFDDPVLNTFFSVSDSRLAALLFHELAHQVVYLPGDSSFNEAFAKTVEIEGVRRWFFENASDEEMQRVLAHEAQIGVFQNFLRETRDQLKELYRQSMAEPEMHMAKRALFRQAGERYAQMKKAGQLDDRFDGWMAHGLNNARLASVATYRDLLPGFQAMLERNEGDLDRFYAAVEELSNLPEPQRYFQLQGRFQVEQHARQRSATGDEAVIAD